MPQLITTATLGGNKTLRGYTYPDYNDAHADGGYALVSATTARPYITIGQSFDAGGNYFIQRLGWIFDTTTLPANAVIFKGFVSFMLKRAILFTGVDFDITLVSGADIADDGLVVADFGDLVDDTASMGSKNTSGLVIDTWYNITLNALGIAAINKGGLTKFGVRSSEDITITPPASAWNLINIYATVKSDYGVKLTVNYATEPGFIWVDGRRFYFISEADKQHIEGRYAGYGATAGHLTVEGLFLVYIDEDGHKRRKRGRKKGATSVDVSNGCPIWVELTQIRYIDANGDERYLPIWWFNTMGFNELVFNA